MKRPDDPTRAGHILYAAQTVLRWTTGKAKADFDADDVLQSAVAYQLQTIGEAASHLSDEFRRAHAEIPWRDVIGMRNILVHAYRRVDPDILREVVQGRLAPLIAVVEETASSQSE